MRNFGGPPALPRENERKVNCNSFHREIRGTADEREKKEFATASN